MQDMILLGFLLDGERTGYQIKKLMENSTNFFFNTSLGSIYPAFKKLETQGMVRMRQKVDEGRVKKIYSITAEGKTGFHEWLEKEITLPKIRNEALLKIFFYSNLEEEVRKAQIGSLIDRTRLQIEELKALKSKLRPLNIDPFQMKTLDHGIAYYSFHLEWYQGFLSDLADNQ
ncbi:MAG: PadR family transcriptional regulator [Proteobacteria bacterium]|nr:PadR family transcriptional regulator [Pseudomonadota bacterium]